MRTIPNWTARLRDFEADRRGAILVEIALSMVVLILLILGGVEIARYVLLQQKLDRIAMSVGDLVSRGETLTAEQLANIFSAAERLAEPFGMSDGRVIVSFISANTQAVPTILWQREGAGGLVVESRIGAAGERPELPPGLVVAANESALVAEVFYDFRPFISPDVIGEKQLYHRAILRPRLSDQSLLQ